MDNLPVPLRSEKRSEAWIRQTRPPCMHSDVLHYLFPGYSVYSHGVRVDSFGG